MTLLIEFTLIKLSDAQVLQHQITEQHVEENPNQIFINKLRIVEEELDETIFFYEMLAEFNQDKKAEIRILFIEANELLSIIISSINTSLKNSIKTSLK